MSSYRPSPLAALLNGLGGSLPDFTNALVQRKWKSQDSAAAMEEKRREEEAKAAMAALGDARDMSRYSLMDIPATAGQRMEADQVLGGAGYNVDRALDPALHTQTEQTPEGYPFQRTYSPDVVARATRVAETLGKMPKPRKTSGSGKTPPSFEKAYGTVLLNLAKPLSAFEKQLQGQRNRGASAAYGQMVAMVMNGVAREMGLDVTKGQRLPPDVEADIKMRLLKPPQ